MVAVVAGFVWGILAANRYTFSCVAFSPGQFFFGFNSTWSLLLRSRPLDRHREAGSLTMLPQRLLRFDNSRLRHLDDAPRQLGHTFQRRLRRVARRR